MHYEIPRAFLNLPKLDPLNGYILILCIKNYTFKNYTFKQSSKLWSSITYNLENSGGGLLVACATDAFKKSSLCNIVWFHKAWNNKCKLNMNF